MSNLANMFHQGILIPVVVYVHVPFADGYEPCLPEWPQKTAAAAAAAATTTTTPTTETPFVQVALLYL